MVLETSLETTLLAAQFLYWGAWINTSECLSSIMSTLEAYDMKGVTHAKEPVRPHHSKKKYGCNQQILCTRIKEQSISRCENLHYYGTISLNL